MDIIFSTSKKGDLTCSIDDYPLHSRYNPVEEANKFVKSINIDFVPTNVIVTGPCLPYLYHSLKEVFPSAKISAIQYSRDFEKHSQSWDKVFLVDSNTSILDFQEELFNYFGEEQLFSSLFLSWKPSEKPFAKQYEITWTSIKNALDKSKILIGTRSYFNKTWLKNSLRFFKFTKNLYFSNEDNKKAFSKKISKPFFITASGPSLNHQVDFIKEYRDSVFLLALSSSVAVLLSNDIIPDCILTTDGGYYAKRHLRILETNPKYSEIPIMVPPEANLPAKILDTNPIIPLNYMDSTDSKLMNFLRMDFLPASRNGTVSGTAAELGIFLSKKNVYFTGLDLASSKGYSHTQPNQLENDNCLSDNKLRSKEQRICPGSFSNESLEIYRNWFATRNENFYKRVFRITSEKDNLKQIPNLSDISRYDLMAREKLSQMNFQKSSDEKNLAKNQISQDKKINIQTCIDFYKSELEKILQNHKTTQEEWFKIASYTDFIQYVKAKECKKTYFFDILLSKTKNLFEEIFEYLSK